MNKVESFSDLKNVLSAIAAADDLSIGFKSNMKDITKPGDKTNCYKQESIEFVIKGFYRVNKNNQKNA
jgi:hypothetical protein